MPRTKTHYNQQRMIDLFKSGKSISQISTLTKASDVWTRRVIANAVPDLYKQSVAHSRSQRAEMRAESTSAVVRAGAGTAAQVMLDKNVVEQIARAVAAATFSDAEYVPKPQTRNEIFAKVSDGVRNGLKTAGYGFHS